MKARVRWQSQDPRGGKRQAWVVTILGDGHEYETGFMESYAVSGGFTRNSVWSQLDDVGIAPLYYFWGDSQHPQHPQEPVSLRAL